MEGSGPKTAGPGARVHGAGSEQGTAVAPRPAAAPRGDAQAARERHLSPLFSSRPGSQQVLLAVVVPAAYGALCGWVVGISEIAYIILAVPLAILGQVAAGFEHRGAREGAIRGVVAGTLFGGFIVIVHELTGEEAKAELPEPLIVQVAVTGIAGSLLGALGGHWREAAEREGRLLDRSQVTPAELLGMGSAVLLFASLFMPWFTTSDDNPNSRIDSADIGPGESANAWETFATLDWLIAAACTAPFILTWIIARGHKLSWRPGEVTMVVAITGLTLVLCNGIILGRPEPGIEIGLGVGYFVALFAYVLMAVAGYLRQAFYTSARKPPGVI
jgi:hypothetical protein